MKRRVLKKKEYLDLIDHLNATRIISPAGYRNGQELKEAVREQLRPVKPGDRIIMYGPDGEYEVVEKSDHIL